MSLRHVVGSEAAAVREIRLASLTADPGAFGSTYDRDAAQPSEAEHGFRALNAAVVAGNDSARRAYESAGFALSHAITWTGDGRTLEELILTPTL